MRRSDAIPLSLRIARLPSPVAGQLRGEAVAAEDWRKAWEASTLTTWSWKGDKGDPKGVEKGGGRSGPVGWLIAFYAVCVVLAACVGSTAEFDRAPTNDTEVVKREDKASP